MRIFYYFSVFFLLLPLFPVACKQHKFSAEQLPSTQLRWGNGGGFVGKQTGYTLLENGQVFYQAAGTALVEMDHTKSKKAKKLFKTAEEMGLGNLNFQHPANTYNFIELVKDSTVQRIVWGDKAHPTPPQVLDLYRSLGDLVRQPKH